MAKNPMYNYWSGLCFAISDTIIKLLTFTQL